MKRCPGCEWPLEPLPATAIEGLLWIYVCVQEDCPRRFVLQALDWEPDKP